METKRINTSVPIGLREINLGETEKSSSTSKSTGVASTKDLVEVAKQNNGGLFAERSQSSQQNQGTSGKKELGTNEQDQVSKNDVSKIDKPSYFGEDSRTRYEESKNSGLLPPFGSGSASKTEDRGPKTLTQDQIASLYSTKSPEQQSDAVQDAARLVDGVGLRDALDQEVAKRNEERNLIGGSQTDRLQSVLDPTARGAKGQNSTSYNNKGMISQDKGGSFGYGVPLKDGEVQAPDSKSGDNLPSVGKVLGAQVTGQANRIDKITSDEAKLNEDTSLYGDKIITGSDGTKVITGKDGTKTVIKQIDGKENKTVLHPNGASETYVDGKKDEKQSNSKLKSYDRENYTGNIPAEIKNLEEYFKNQARQGRQTGGELIQVDPNAEPIVMADGQKTIHLTQTGETGMVGQPNRAGEDVGDASHFDGGANPDVNGGYTDPGDGNNWSGRTIKDDPSDVHFGPAAQPKEQPKSDKKDEKDSSTSSLFDEINLKRQIRIR